MVANRFIFLILLLSGVYVFPCLASENEKALRVITRNLDNGTDFGPIFAAQTPAQLVTAVSITFAEIQASKIGERAAAVAKEIAAERPDLVGLQEVYTYRTGSAGGIANTVVYDALQLLQDELAKLGLQYAPVAILTNLDATLPAFSPISGLFSVRATDHDVMLVRTDQSDFRLRLLNIRAQHFTNNAVILSPLLGSLEILRGWISVDAKVRGQDFRFVTTHLESVSTAVQTAQARELLADSANAKAPLVLVGDFNSDAQSSDPRQSSAHDALLVGGFKDTWIVRGGNSPGYTWPLHGEDPYTPFATPNQRLDWIMIRGEINPLTIKLLGNQLTDLTVSGLWPSDHVGLSATFLFAP